MNEDQIRELLRDMRDDPVPADSLARVRGRVAERVAAKSWFKPWGIAAMITIEPPPRPAAPVVAEVEYPRVAPAVPARPKPVVRKARVKPVRRVENVTASGAPVLIRIETPDPEVVILLIGDGD
jgi:hypothetical protein